MKNKVVKDAYGGLRMNKIKELFGIEDAHTFAEVSKKKAGKIFADAEVLERVMAALNNEGKVFAIREKKEIVCYYIFNKVQTERDEVMEEYYEENMTREYTKVYAYKLVEEYWKPEKEHLREGFEKTIRANLKEYISWGMAKEVLWYEDVYVLEKGKRKVFNPAGIGIGALYAIAYGSSLDNMALGIPMGMMWAIVFSMMFNIDNKKLVKKEENDAITQ